jgi:hypothetical protein
MKILTVRRLLCQCRVSSGQDHALQAAGIERLGLTGLPPDAAAAFLDEQQGAHPAPHIPDALVRAAGGNPVALVELLRTLTPISSRSAGRYPIRCWSGRGLSGSAS